MISRPYDKLGSAIYNALIQRYRWKRYAKIDSLWERLWQKRTALFSGPVTTTIHGQRVAINPGNQYPLTIRMFPTYNNPLIELVYQNYRKKNEPIKLVDVGAATGDTIILLKGNCPNMVGEFFCVDGDAEFFRYLQHNLGGYKEGHLLFAMLSGSEGMERELVRTHTTTASAQGTNQVPAVTLDRLLGKAGADKIDVLKIDVDGFDGQVLRGAQDILNTMKPSVIFEWHPILCEQTNNSSLLPFEVLESCGYSAYIWFDKFGRFSHFMKCFDTASVDMLKDFCINSKTHFDWHYDVIALPAESQINPRQLAELEYASNKPSPL